jgi:phosphoglycolate phosphatase-like HAD superfamily hydrolase
VAPLPALPPYANELFSHMLSRAFTPTKPHPAPLLHLCAAWGVHPSQCVMVGDSLDDIACARAAGTVGVLIGADARCAIYREALPHADFTIASLSELAGVIEALDAAHAEAAAASAPVAVAGDSNDAGDTIDVARAAAR